MIRTLQKKIQEGATRESLVAAYLDRIAEQEATVGAFISVDAEGALKAAKEQDATDTVLPFAGMVIGIKDNFCVAGGRTTAGSKMLENFIAPYDATAVRRLREAGAVLVGKTNLDEFAFGSSTENSAYHTTKNPHDTERVPGGTSGGSAAAVAANMVAFALGSDTGGSIRQPAAYCGVVGLKPTYGRISRYGLIAAASSLDTVGTLTQSVEDAAILLSVLAGEDIHDATAAPLPTGKLFENHLETPLAGVRIGVPREYFPETLDAEVRDLLQKRLKELEARGATLVDISLPHARYALPAYYIIQTAEASSNLARFDGCRYGVREQHKKEGREVSPLLATYLDTRAARFGSEAKRRIMLGTYALSSGYYDAYYQKAQKVRALLKQDFEKAFEEVDVIFSPTTPDVAFRIGEKEDPLTMYLTDIYTVTANLVGVPAISVPVGNKLVDGKALPVGAQLLAKWFDEETLLSVAWHLEQIVYGKSD